MNDKEYTYDIGKYTIGVDTNGEDGIGMTVAIIKDGGINFLGNCYGENARCIDLLIKENQELKKQVKENKDNYNCLLEQKEQFEYIMSKQVDYQGQKKEFIKYLEDMLDDENDIFSVVRVKDVLSKYKQIIGVSDDNKTTI